MSDELEQDVDAPPVDEPVPDDIDTFPEDITVPAEPEAAAPSKPDNPLDFDDTYEDLPFPSVKEDAEEESEEEPEEVEEPVAVAEVPASLREEAAALGMTPAMIEAIPADELDSFLSQYRPDDDDSADDADATPDDEGFDITKLEGIDPDLIEPDVMEVFKKMQEHYDARYEAQRERLDQLLDVFETQAVQQQVERFDELLRDLPKSWNKTFGDGGSGKLDPKSEHRAARDKLWDTMMRQAQGYEARSEPVPPEPKLFDEALRVAFGDQLETMTRAKVRDGMRKREKRLISRPTDRVASEPTSTAKAIASVAEFMSDHNELDPEYEAYVNGLK